MMDTHDGQHRSILRRIAHRAMLEKGLVPDFPPPALAELDGIHGPATRAEGPARDLRNLLGFAEHDIQVLMAVGKLTPLGDPVPNAPKWFAAVEVIRLAADQDWLHKATKEITKYWRSKRERRQTRAPS